MGLWKCVGQIDWRLYLPNVIAGSSPEFWVPIKSGHPSFRTGSVCRGFTYPFGKGTVPPDGILLISFKQQLRKQSELAGLDGKCLYSVLNLMNKHCFTEVSILTKKILRKFSFYTETLFKKETL